MAKEVLTRVWCDPCLGAGDHEPATHEELIQIGNGKPRTVDLCDTHHKGLVVPLLEVLDEYGATVATPQTPQFPGSGRSGVKHSSGPFYCAVPGCKNGRTSPFKNSGSLGGHLRNQHGVSMGEYRERYTRELVPLQTYPLDGTNQVLPRTDDALFADDDQQPSPYGDSVTCDLCGKVYSREQGNRRPTLALGVHMARAHGVESPKKKKKD